MAITQEPILSAHSRQSQGWIARLKEDPLPNLAGLGVILVLVLVSIGLLIAEKPAVRPPLKVLGGGFIFNYRISDIFYGVTLVPVHSVKLGDVVEARFENPAGGSDIVVRTQFGLKSEPIQLRTPPLRGVVADKPYKVVLRLLSRESDEVRWSSTLHYQSNIDGSLISREPPVIGPGYHRNPAYIDDPVLRSQAIEGSK